ncbi:MAG: PAS domain-containing protein, partial [Candidatus Dadabacteria bacterium]|nr:PAS domain-containing protein [Candidatus Dadabacteria bacterium]
MILDAAGEGIYGLDLQGITTFINPAAANLLGWKPSEMIGQPQHKLIHYAKHDGKHYPV